MLLRNIALLTIIVGQVAVYACLGPENVFGINFTDGESIDTNAIEGLGEKDINYYKNKNEEHWVKYSFRSHWNSSIMVEVMKLTPPSVNEVGSLSFTIDTSVVPLAGFPFETCVRTELDWLVEAGVVAMDRLIREQIEKAFEEYADSILGEAGFYWTKQEMVLPNYAAITKEGIVVPAQGCGDIAFAQTDLPPQPLDIVVRIVTKDTKTFSRGYVAAGPDHSTMLVVDICGRMHRQQGPAGLMSHPSGILLGFDRRSGAVKRVVTLP
ncbi:MAG: hypothetical protein JW863_16535 [Chitinispirillaceae bacterium]|nr:hypothetical protein [Chitinispirillaceae bacterium]